MSLASDTHYRHAPPGFDADQWQRFARDGYLVLEDAISGEALERYRDAHRRLRESKPGFEPTSFGYLENVVELDPVVAELIDHPRHVGFAYDLYGELLKVHLSQMFWRPHGSKCTEWHIDGPRAVPMADYSPVLPLLMKVGYWLTPLENEDVGNLVVIPGSHRQRDLDQYNTHEPAAGEIQLRFPAGTVTLMDGSLWHRTAVVADASPRESFYIAYCPSWVASADRLHADPEWLKNLTRERRILMREYSKPYQSSKPPPEDSPLFLPDPDQVLPGADDDAYLRNVPGELRRRPLRLG